MTHGHEVLADTFFSGHEATLPLYEQLKGELVWRYPEMEIRVAKTQISFYDRRMFGCASFTRVKKKAEMPENFLTVTIGLPDKLDSPRVAVQSEPYPGRWTIHVVISSEEDLDDELFSWFDRAHEFAMQKR